MINDNDEIYIIVKAYYLKEGKPLRIDVYVTEKTYPKVRGRLESERLKILKILELFKQQEVIKSIRRPHNKKIQPYLNELVKAKQEINKTIEKLMILFT